MSIAENITLGLDLGTASIGWALTDNAAGKVLSGGVRTFEAPETGKKRTPKNQIRREARLLRRTVRRRAQRMVAVRRLLAEHGFAEAGAEAEDPWAIRAQGLKQLLSPAQFARALAHIAKHRGFQSNRKGGDNAAPDEDKKALAAMSVLAIQIAPYTTFGEALACDEELQKRTRNRTGDYGRTPKRQWLREEVGILFERQHRFGLDAASPELQRGFVDLAFSQRPLQDQEDRVRRCPFEPDERRASKHAPSFERFRLLQSLAHMTLWERGARDRSLTAEEIGKIAAAFGHQASLTFKTVRRLIDLSPSVRFRGVPETREDQDIAARKGQSAQGTRAMQAALGDMFDKLSPAQLDNAMATIAFRETEASIRRGLEEIGIPAAATTALVNAVAAGEFLFATGAAHISAKACRAILPGLRSGLVYSEACERAGYNHSAGNASLLVGLRAAVASRSLTEQRKAVIAVFADADQAPIGSPVARKALIEAVKQFAAIVHEHPCLRGNLPGAVHVEVARDVGKSAKERSDIHFGIEERNDALDALAEEFEETLGRPPRKQSDELRMYELAKEQGWKSLYSDAPIDPRLLLDGGSYQIDHILPWSRFGDDSYTNLTICLASENQAKQNKTPFEWFSAANKDWDGFLARVEACREMKGRKKWTYLLRNAAEVEEAFRNRHLNDTRWAARLLLQAIEALYPIEPNEKGNPIRRIRARPGPLTAKLRRAWGLEGLKKDVDGNRLADDRHHALDALVVAATTEAMLSRLTRAHQQAERLGKGRVFERVDPPWPKFVEETEAMLAGVFVSRAESRRARGQAHLDTIYGHNEKTGRVIERLTPAELLDAVNGAGEKDADLRAALEARIERPERSRAIIDALVRWQLAGRPPQAPPQGPTGDPIRKVRAIASGQKPAVMLRHGTAGRGDMVRVDVFGKPNRRGVDEFYLVPIYPHQVADANKWPHPPQRAVVGRREDSEWTLMDATFRFRFAIHPLSWLEATTTSGEVKAGYFRGLDRGNGSIALSEDRSLQSRQKGIGVRRLASFRKLHVDRLGNKHEIGQEPRTWRGAVCTYPTQPSSA